jgi:hypothetical protein
VALAIALSGCSPALGLAEAPSPDLSPEQVVEAFYHWYIDYPGNAMADEAYHSSEYLAEEWVQKVDEIIASFTKGGYDPFLCAQDIPQDLRFDEAIVSGRDARVAVHEIWNPGTPHELVCDLEVVLKQADGEWKIVEVTCPEAGAARPIPESPIPTSAEGAVSGFYDWYLRYVREEGNPLVTGAYRSSEYLTPDLIQKMDETIASFDGAGYDPFLCAQDVPESYAFDDVVVSGDEAEVVVHTSFADHTFVVRLQQVNGRWAVSDVICAERRADEQEPPPRSDKAEGWQVYRDDEYGFRIQYPADWTMHEAKLATKESDSPIVRVLGFVPPGWQGRVSPVSVEVGVGKLDEMRMWPISAAEQTGAAALNDCVMLIGKGMYGETFYVFQHPDDNELYVAMRDNIGEQADRAQIEAIDTMISSFRFTEQ